MKQAPYSSGPIPIPENISGVAGLARWASDVRKSLIALRDRRVYQRANPSFTKTRSVCAFGSITSWLSGEVYVSGVTGGTLVCGASNFYVASHEVDKTVDADFLLEISLTGIAPQTDDDVSIFLPGIASVSGTPAWNEITYTGSQNYTATTQPTAPGGTGTIIIPIGRVIVSGGGINFFPSACGEIQVSACAGLLTYTRPEVAA